MVYQPYIFTEIYDLQTNIGVFWSIVPKTLTLSTLALVFIDFIMIGIFTFAIGGHFFKNCDSIPLINMCNFICLSFATNIT